MCFWLFHHMTPKWKQKLASSLHMRSAHEKKAGIPMANSFKHLLYSWSRCPLPVNPDTMLFFHTPPVQSHAAWLKHIEQRRCTRYIQNNGTQRVDTNTHMGNKKRMRTRMHTVLVCLQRWIPVEGREGATHKQSGCQHGGHASGQPRILAKFVSPYHAAH